MRLDAWAVTADVVSIAIACIHSLPVLLLAAMPAIAGYSYNAMSALLGSSRPDRGTLLLIVCSSGNLQHAADLPGTAPPQCRAALTES